MINEIETLKKIAYIYYLDEEFAVIAGRTSKDNEYLSLKFASQKDWWFHVRSVPGSHVIMRSLGNKEPDRRQKEVAAAVAAYHSKARNAGVVPVACTRAINVSKPSGSPVGTVRIKKEEIIKTRPALPEK